MEPTKATTALAYDAIIGKLRIKLQRQENAISETKQHITAIENLRDSTKTVKRTDTI